VSVYDSVIDTDRGAYARTRISLGLEHSLSFWSSIEHEHGHDHKISLGKVGLHLSYSFHALVIRLPPILFLDRALQWVFFGLLFPQSHLSSQIKS
jgi:hypothetical protein